MEPRKANGRARRPARSFPLSGGASLPATARRATGGTGCRTRAGGRTVGFDELEHVAGLRRRRRRVGLLRQAAESEGRALALSQRGLDGLQLRNRRAAV